MVNLIIDVKAGYDFGKQFVMDRGIEINPTNFLLDKLSMTEEELDTLGTSFAGKWKLKHILTHLNFFRVLENRLRDGYRENWFKNEAADGFKLEISNVRYEVVKPAVVVPEIDQEAVNSIAFSEQEQERPEQEETQEYQEVED